MFNNSGYFHVLKTYNIPFEFSSLSWLYPRINPMSPDLVIDVIASRKLGKSTITLDRDDFYFQQQAAKAHTKSMDEAHAMFAKKLGSNVLSHDDIVKACINRRAELGWSIDVGPTDAMGSNPHLGSETGQPQGSVVRAASPVSSEATELLQPSQNTNSGMPQLTNDPVKGTKIPHKAQVVHIQCM